VSRSALKSQSRAFKRGARWLRFEQLEDRRVLATFTVNNLGDAAVTAPGSAPGTLRQAIYDANNSSGPDEIKFASGLSGTINLTVTDDFVSGATALLITSPIRITGNPNGITIARGPSASEMRLIRVAASGNLTFELISMTGGIARGANGTSPGETGGNARGGAILNQGTLQVIATSIYSNQAIGGDAAVGGTAGIGLGGAIYNDSGTLAITNATFSGNSVSSGAGNVVPKSYGGAVYARNGSLAIHNSTLTNNNSWTGRGVYVLGADGTAIVDIQSTIIGQTDLPFEARDLIASVDVNGQITVTGGHNLIRSQNDFAYITALTDDPQLGPLANNGGPTPTHALTAGSPAVNQGSNSLGLTTDQRGTAYSRVIAGTADIGAFELQTSVGPALPGDYNGNQVVDGADYVVWRKTLGAGVPPYSGADGSGNGAVDTADYGVWRGHFGATPAVGDALLPEEPRVALGTASSEVPDESALIQGNAITAASGAALPAAELGIVTRRGGVTPSQGNGHLIQSAKDLLLAPRSGSGSATFVRGDAFDIAPNGNETEVAAQQELDQQILDQVWAAWPHRLSCPV
jgi:hypothetical protein